MCSLEAVGRRHLRWTDSLEERTDSCPPLSDFPKRNPLSPNLVSRFLRVSWSMSESEPVSYAWQGAHHCFVSWIMEHNSENRPQALPGSHEVLLQLLTNETRQAFLTVHGFLFCWVILNHGKNFDIILNVMKLSLENFFVQEQHNLTLIFNTITVCPNLV